MDLLVAKLKTYLPTSDWSKAKLVCYFNILLFFNIGLHCLCSEFLISNLFSYPFAFRHQIHLVMLHREHYSVYCINVAHKRIDILDCLDCKRVGTEFSSHHNKQLMKLLLPRLSEAFQKISKRFPNLSSWRHCQYSKVPLMKHENDCAAFTMRFVESYDGEGMTLAYKIDPVSVQPFRTSHLATCILLHTQLSSNLTYMKNLLRCGQTCCSTCYSTQPTPSSPYLVLSSFIVSLLYAPKQTSVIYVDILCHKGCYILLRTGMLNILCISVMQFPEHPDSTYKP